MACGVSFSISILSIIVQQIISFYTFLPLRDIFSTELAAQQKYRLAYTCLAWHHPLGTGKALIKCGPSALARTGQDGK
jgi:hypothetical protein